MPPARRRRPGPAKGTPRAKRLPRAEREEQILAIAEEIFARHGYAETTMESIAEAAGITKPVIYDYFTSKEGLLAAGITRARGQLRAATVEVWRAMPPDASLQDLFRVGLTAYFAFIDQHASAFQLIQQEAAVSGHAESGIENIRVEQSQVLLDALLGTPDLAGVPLVRLEAFSEIVIGACERMAVWRLRRPEVSAKEAADLVFDTVWPGIKPFMPDAEPGTT